MRRRYGQRGGGFTLVEALLAGAVLSMSVAAIMVPFTAGAQNELVDTRRTLAVNLAQEMMEEILAKPFDDPQGTSQPGPELDETSRACFDNIDDYDGYGEEPWQISSFDGDVIDDPAAAGLSRQVTADYVYVSGQDAADDPTFIRVVVEVRHRDVPIVALTRLVYAWQ